MAAADEQLQKVERLVEDNIRLAHFFAQKWAWKLGENDALSIALEGLHSAAKGFDETKGIPFGTFASHSIKWAFGRAHNHAKRQKRGGGAVHVSFDQPLGEDGGATIGDVLKDEGMDSAAEEVAFADQQGQLRSLLGKLKDRDAQVIIARFGLDGDEKQTLDEIAKRIGLTRERVRQIEDEALGRLASMTGVNRVKKPRRAPAEKATPHEAKLQKLQGDYWNEENARSPSPRKAAGSTYREKNREKIQAYFRKWRQDNAEAIAAYRLRMIERIRKYRMIAYYRHRDKILERRRDKYVSDDTYAEKIRVRTRKWKQENQEKNRTRKAEYRAKNREALRVAAKKYAKNLTASYLRRQLSKLSCGTRRAESFSFEEVEAHRAHLQARRDALALRPKCPKCGGRGRKNGFFKPSGRQKYSCAEGCGAFSLPIHLSLVA